MNIESQEPAEAVQPEPVTTLVPMLVGSAMVYVEQSGGASVVEADASIYPVAPPDPRDAFVQAVGVIRECVQAVGKQIESFKGEVRPDELTLEFSVTFDVRAKVSPIPVLVTGETGGQTGLKVVAVWRRPETETG